ncbi:MAG: phosphoglycerate dehydrogenase, partial [Acetobacter orientalis]
GLDNVILTPHIGGSTAEAQESIGVEVDRKLVEYSDVGSTFGAVNFPGVQLPQSPRGTRFMHVHQNIPGMMMRLNEIFLHETCNVTAQFLQTDGDIGYVVIEADTGHNTDLDDRILAALRSLEGTIRARLIYKGR